VRQTDTVGSSAHSADDIRRAGLDAWQSKADQLRVNAVLLGRLGTRPTVLRAGAAVALCALLVLRA